MYDFGDFNSNGVMGDPYMKLLSIVDPDEASIEFHQIRGGTPETNITFTGLGGASIAPSFWISNDISESLELIGKFIPALLGIVAFNALVLIVCCIVWLVSFCRKRSRKNVTMRTPRRRLSPIPANPRNSYIAGMTPSAINSHSYEPVSMALTDDTFVPPSPAFHRSNKKGNGNGRPYSLANTQVYEPVSPGTDDAFSPTYRTEHRMSTIDNNSTSPVGDRGSTADANSSRRERVSLRGDRASIRDDRISLRDERVSLKEQRLSPRTTHRPSMDPLTQEVLPVDDTARSSMHSHLYERSLTAADGDYRLPSPNMQTPASAKTAFTPPASPTVPYPHPVASSTDGGNFSPSTQASFRPDIGPGRIAGSPVPSVHDALQSPNPGYLLPLRRSSNTSMGG